jgi:hypothetical protein
MSFRFASAGFLFLGLSAIVASDHACANVRDFHRASSDDGYWSLVDTDAGCVWIKVTGEWDYSDSAIFTAASRTVNWSGACDQGALIDGAGTLTVETVSSDGSKSRNVFHGTAKEGFFDGAISTQAWTDWGGGNGYQEDQGWFDYQYRMGCSYDASDCDSAAGVAFRDSVVGGAAAPSQGADAGDASAGPRQSVKIGYTTMVLPEIVMVGALGTGCVRAELRNAFIREDHDKVYWGEGDWVLSNHCAQEQAVWTETRGLIVYWPNLGTPGAWADGSTVGVQAPFPNALSSSPRYVIPAAGEITMNSKTIALLPEGQQRVEVITASCNASSETGTKQVLFQAAVSLFSDKPVACLPSTIPR